MFKVQTTSKVSMKLTSWINLGRRGVRAELSTLDTAHRPPRPPHNSPERATPRPTRTHIPHRNHQQPPQDRKSDPKWQSQTMSKAETTSKVPLKPTNSIQKPFKNDKQCALFHPKYSLCSQETVSPVSIL